MHFLLAALLFACLFSCALPHKAFAESDETVVKVAYVFVPGFQEGGEGEYKSGEGYEYLQNIAGYTGWTYEYVYGTFDELLQKLEAGEIDLMGNLSYTDERAKDISYGLYEQGKESFYLFVAEGYSDIKSDDLSTLNGKRIGVLASSYQAQLWKDWCQENSIDCEIVEYASAEDRQNALRTGEVDAVTESTTQGSTNADDNWRAVIRFGDAPYYFGVSKSRADLLQQLNKAQALILSENPFYNEEVSLRYSQTSSLTTKQLTDEEIAWLNQRDGLIRVGMMDNYLPIADETNEGEMKGVVADLLKEIESEYAAYNVHFDIRTYQSTAEILNDFNNGEIDLMPTYGDYWNADRQSYSITNSFMSTTMLMLNEGSYAPDSIVKVGYDAQSPLQAIYAEIHSSEYEWVEYSSMTEAAEALHKGKIDSALCTACSYHVFAKTNTLMRDLNRVTLPGKVNITMAVARQNASLRSFINRGISVVGEARIFNSLALNSNVDRKTTIFDFVIDNPAQTFLAICLIAIAIAAAAYTLHRSQKKSETDSMTGLLNKATMLKGMGERIKKGGVLFMIDIDDFKLVNDKLGHQVGDQVIAHLTDSLQEVFRPSDLLGRFGGDEFIVFMSGKSCDESLVKKKADQLKGAFEENIRLADQSCTSCSVSIGALCIAAGENISVFDAIEKADAALYEAKKNGKGTYAMASSEPNVE